MSEREQPCSGFPQWRLKVMLCTAMALVVACATMVPQQGWDPAFGPVVPHDTFPADCSLCHAEGSWHELRPDFTYDHAAQTGVALVGAHRDAGCLLCHNDRGPVAAFAARGCAGCHPDPHLQRLGDNCADCHDEVTWRPRAAIARHDRTRFPLVGAHAAVACFRCHAGAQVGNFAGAPVECVHCHGGDLARATDPNHLALGYSRRCEECHVPTGWQPARFDHPATFPLTNGHGGRACASCHSQPNSFAGLSRDCATCHADDYAATTEPAHAAAGFGTDCSECHDTRSFAAASWLHPPAFPLTFGHGNRRCTECHAGQSFGGTQSACSTCHLDDYQATVNPNHVQSGFGLDCTACHRTTSWRPSTFAHSFPITSGDHFGLGCAECHTNPSNQSQFSCIDCHEHRQSEMNDKHDGIPGYVWASSACYGCHPNGTKDG